MWMFLLCYSITLSFYIPRLHEVEGGYTAFTSSVRLSVRPSVRPWAESLPLCIFHKLAGSIVYFHVLSTNFRMCVVCWVPWIIWTFSNLSKFVTLTLSCVHSIWMGFFYCSHLGFSMVILLDGLLTLCPVLGHNLQYPIFDIFLIVPFTLC